MELSVIIPCYEEDECLPLLFDRVIATLGSAGLSYELVFVNDGSRDKTWQLIDGFARSGRAPRVVGVDFSRNSGKEAALLAGLSHATGEVVGIMDADLQQEPQTLLAMYGELMAHPEADCVAAYQSARHEGALKALLKGAFYRVFKDITHRTSASSAAACPRRFSPCPSTTASPRGCLPGWALRPSRLPTSPPHAREAPQSGPCASSWPMP